MKKFFAILLAAVLLMGMTACSCDNTNAPADDSTGGEQTALSGTMEENVTRLIQANPVEFMGGVIPVDLKDTSEEGLWALRSYTGLDSAKDITDIAVYEPMTGAQAFSLVLVRVAQGADPKAVAQTMKDNIDPRKWICAMADQVMAAGYQDTVMFIMVDSQLGKTAQSYVDAFRDLCGGKLDFTI